MSDTLDKLTERELLVKAAKAAGISFNPHPAASYYWNPLANDGDALRLFVRLPFCELYVSEIGCTVTLPREPGSVGLKCDEYASEHGGDLNAATRLAIVRAAAAIGEKQQ